MYNLCHRFVVSQAQIGQLVKVLQRMLLQDFEEITLAMMPILTECYKIFSAQLTAESETLYHIVGKQLSGLEKTCSVLLNEEVTNMYFVLPFFIYLFYLFIVYFCLVFFFLFLIYSINNLFLYSEQCLCHRQSNPVGHLDPSIPKWVKVPPRKPPLL
jgi:hypothetical protein